MSFPEQPYVHEPYPSTRYHRDGSVAVVNDREHEAAIAPAAAGWRDTPAAFATDDATPPETPASAPAKRKR